MDLKVLFQILSLFLILNCVQKVASSVAYFFEQRINEFSQDLGRGTVLNCISKCAQMPDCTCVRMATDTIDTCEPLATGMDANGFNHEGFVYYSMRPANMTETNVALKKTASQSSVFELNGITYTADRAVDGSYNTEVFKLPYLTQTKDGNNADTFPWWTVDLRKEHLISSVRILNRKDHADRLHDLEIRIGNRAINSDFNHAHFSNASSNGLCARHSGGGIKPSEYLELKCEPCLLRGRYVSIQITKFCDDCKEKNRNVLSLAEVEIYGSPIQHEKESSREKNRGKVKYGKVKEHSVDDYSDENDT
ncbi:pentraxin fusion protein-like [Brevipalpus obovatus]|uniref:pentraxin fusion protein-like n=1 Tax=Brevipalpus obovatus TaxID=246614 RepID=UPI003D9DEC2A